MPCFVCFLNFPCNKKYPENKSSPNALKLLYDFFLEYLRIFGTENTLGGPTMCQRGWGACPQPRGPHMAPSTYSCTHTLRLPPEKIIHQLKPEFYLILLPFLISLLKAPFTKLLWGIVLWYVTPPMVQLVFVLGLYSLQFFAA